MKCIMRNLAAYVAVVLLPLVANAQETKWEYDSYPHVFVDVQGGARTVAGDLWDLKLLQPSVQLSIGGYLNRYFGMRFAVNGVWGKSMLDKAYEYKYNTFAGDVDLLLDVTNLFRKKDRNPFHFILFAGAGLMNSWNYKYGELPAEATLYEKYFERNHYTAHARVGTQFKVNCSRLVDLNLEVNANPFGARFDRQVMNKDDNQVTAYLGLTFKFGQNKHAVVSKPVVEEKKEQPVVAPSQPKVESRPKAEPKPAVKNEPAPAPAELTQNVFFMLNSSEITNEAMASVQNIVDFMSKYPDAVLTITGYADKNTGNTRYNQRLSKARAEQVAHEIAKRGIARERVVVDFKGDTEQPFSENDRNRVVIGNAKEKK